MLTKEQYEKARSEALKYYEKANIILTEEEKENVEIADFGLGDLYNTGLEIVVYVNTDRVCAKEMVVFPGQICPEHRHPPMPEINYPGKEETFRVRYGEVYFYTEGEPAAHPKGKVPNGEEDYYTVWHEVVLTAGQQYTLTQNTRHWFQAGPDGAVVSEFSTPSHDDTDIFTDPRIARIPVIE